MNLFKVIKYSLALLISINVSGQTCSCYDHFSWVKSTFEQNDAGFELAVEKKGSAAYKIHNDTLENIIRKITDPDDCQEALATWLGFFRSGHLFVQVEQNKIKNQKSDKNIYTNLPTVETVSISEKSLRNYLVHLKTPSLEGIWVSSPYTIGIRKIGSEFVGFIIEADGVLWKKGDVKFRIHEDEQSATYYLKDHTEREFKNIKLIGNNYLQMDFVMLHRTFPKYSADLLIDLHYKFMYADKPLFEIIDKNTCALRIPSFSGESKADIDRVLKRNDKRIKSSQNLIIDLRDNGGGDDVSFERLLPLIYTNPVRIVGMQFRSTVLNNQRMEQFLNDPSFSKSEKEWFKRSLVKLNQHLGEFVNLDSNEVEIDVRDTVYKFPEKVAILINGGNGSTTEQFLLAAKQSKKVKLFGTSTAGVLDISNMHTVNSPCGHVRLGYCLSKSLRNPDQAIDGKGIQPDVHFDAKISDFDWLRYTLDIINHETH